MDMKTFFRFACKIFNQNIIEVWDHVILLVSSCTCMRLIWEKLLLTEQLIISLFCFQKYEKLAKAQLKKVTKIYAQEKKKSEDKEKKEVTEILQSVVVCWVNVSCMDTKGWATCSHTTAHKWACKNCITRLFLCKWNIFIMSQVSCSFDLHKTICVIPLLWVWCTLVVDQVIPFYICPLEVFLFSNCLIIKCAC